MTPRPNLKSGRRITLIAALRCKNAGNQDEVLFLGDRQETCGDYQNWIEKLQCGTAGKIDYVMGGAGFGSLIDAFRRKLIGVLTLSSGQSKQQLEEEIQWALNDFFKNEYKQYPAPNKDKWFTCLIGLRHSDSPNTFLWKTDGPLLSKVTTYALTGHEAPIYEHEIKRLYAQNLGTKTALRLGIHLFKLAKLTSVWVDGPTQIILLQPNGI